VRRLFAAAALVFAMLTSACSSGDTSLPSKTTQPSLQSEAGVEPCVKMSDVRALIDDQLAVLQLDTNLREEVDNTGFASRYCTYVQVGSPSREVLSITTYREGRGHPAFDAVSRLYDKSIPGSVHSLDDLLPALKHAAKADVIESKEKNSTGVLINVGGTTYMIMVPYSLADATKKAQQMVVRLMAFNANGTAA